MEHEKDYTMEEMQEKLDNFAEKMQELRKELIEKIYDFLNKRGSKFEFSEDDSFFDDIPFITYDGGNRPDDQSSLYNKVYSITAKRKWNRAKGCIINTFTANTEMHSEYEASRMSFDDIACIFNCIRIRVLRQS